MTTGTEDTIGKLETLLARVKARARGAALSSPTAAGSETPLTTAPDTRISATHEVGSRTQAVPADRESTELEVSSELIEVDIDLDDVETTATMAAAAPALELEVVDESEEEEEPVRVPGANEVVEIAPSSSPRPIGEGAEPFPVPRHTPPPESGKQIASNVPPSTPPSSLEGHTLIGGWQKSGVPSFGPPNMSGAAPPAAAAPAGLMTPKDAPRQDRPQPFRPEATTQPSSQLAPHVPKPRGGQALPPTVLGPELTRPAVAIQGPVATFEGSAPAVRPQTFGDVLDATLGL